MNWRVHSKRVPEAFVLLAFVLSLFLGALHTFTLPLAPAHACAEAGESHLEGSDHSSHHDAAECGLCKLFSQHGDVPPAASAEVLASVPRSGAALPPEAAPLERARASDRTRAPPSFA